ncbi:hypothetical protein CsatB_026761 [Cannabis sativa]
MIFFLSVFVFGFSGFKLFSLEIYIFFRSNFPGFGRKMVENGLLGFVRWVTKKMEASIFLGCG